MNKNNKHVAVSSSNKLGENFLKNRSDIKEIEAELLKSTSLRVIGSKYNCSISSLSRYKKKYLAKKCNAMQAKKDLREGDQLLNLLESYIDNVNKVSSACLEQLQDPDDPDKLFLGASADDIMITYISGYTENGRPIKAKEKLQVLIDRQNLDTPRIQITAPDRAETLLKASQAMNKHIHLFGELKGMLGNVTINITNQPVFIEFTQQVLQASAEFPEVRMKIAESLRAMAIEQTEAEDTE